MSLNKLLLSSLITGIVTAFLCLPILFLLFGPLALFINALAFGLTTTIGAIGVAFVLINMLGGTQIAISHALLFSLPALFLSYKALQYRTAEASGEVFYYPPERIIYWVIGGGLFGSLCIYLPFASTAGGLPAHMIGVIVNDVEVINLFRKVSNIPLSPDQMQEVVHTALITMTLFWVAINLANMFAAQFIVQKCGLNRRPSPDYHNLKLPVQLEILFALTLIAALLAHGWVQIWLFSGILSIFFAFFLLGLAAIHAISRPWKLRFQGLSLLYLVLLLVPWAFLPIGIIGLLEARLGLRQKFCR